MQYFLISFDITRKKWKIRPMVERSEEEGEVGVLRHTFSYIIPSMFAKGLLMDKYLLFL